MLAYVVVGSISAVVIFWTLNHIRNVLRNPSVPGPWLAKWTDLWIVWKTYGMHFEEWNVAQHAAEGKIIRVGPKKYSIDDPEALKQLYGFHNAYKKTNWYTAFANPDVGPNDSVFSVQDRQFHAQMRKRQAAWYAMTTVKSYEPYVDECITAFLKQFDANQKSGSTFDMQVWLQCYTFDAIGQMTFGQRHNFIEQGGDIEGMMEFIWNAMTFSGLLGLTYPWGLPFLILKYGTPTAAIQTFVGTLRDRAAAKSYKVTAEDDDEGKPTTFYEKILKAEHKDPEDSRKYRVSVVTQQNMLAGSDTTSLALTSIIYNCIKHPEVWKKLREELREAADRGQIGSPISFEETQNLPYLQRVIKEGIRVHSPVGVPLWREVPEGGANISGKFFTAGTWVGINSWVAHQNKSVFGDDAASFNPDRWNPATTRKDKLDAMEAYFLAFGGGTRICIGRHVAGLVMTKLVPELVRRYDLQLVYPEKKLETENNLFVKQKHLDARVYAAEKPF